MSKKNIANKAQKFAVILGGLGLLFMVGGVTSAFFNYTRTGNENVVKTGNIEFNFTENVLHLENVFPINSSDVLTDQNNVGVSTVNIQGNTSYNGGIEYLVSVASGENLILNGQSIPVSVNIDTTQDTNKTIGSNDTDYFDNRGGSTSIYKVLAKDTIAAGEKLLVGYIAPNEEINGKITLRVYFDESKIGVSDTYYGGETPRSFGEGKVVLTTEEWNALQDSPIIFKIKVEANEGIWVENEVLSITPMITRINAGSNNSDDNYLTLTTNNANVVNEDNKMVWVNNIEYNDETNLGVSRFTVKVDKDFIKDEDTYYDITINYLDEGEGNILLQSSSTANNARNYLGYGYSNYVEDYPIWSERTFYIKNLTYSLTNTGTWKNVTFNVTNEFFEKDIDNYMHLYFGKDVRKNGEPTTIKVSQITVTKRMFKIDSIDQNNRHIVGNIYNVNNFGMGFSVKNVSGGNTEAKITYEVLDIDDKLLAKKVVDNVLFTEGEVKNYYLDNVNKNGVFTLVVKVDYGEYVEIEKIKFSRMIDDLSTVKNNFLGLTAHLNYGGWYNENVVNDSLDIIGKLGFGNIRQGVNDRFVRNDLQSGDFTNTLGRYEETFDTITNSSFTVLPIVWDTYTNIATDGNGIITDASLEDLKNELIEYYLKFATKYKNKLVYYEMPGEWNQKSFMTPEKYAYLVVEVSKRIKEVDTDAKIVAISSFDDIWCDNQGCSYYTRAESNHQEFQTNSWFARVFDTKWEDQNNVEHDFLYYIDFISLDFYPYTFSNSIMDNYYFERIDGVRKIINHYNTLGKDIPIILTETGFHTGENGATEKSQAINLVEIIVFALANKGNKQINGSNFVSYNFDRVYIYSLQDEAQNNKYGESNYGIVNFYRDNKIKPFTRDVEMSAKASYVAINMVNYLLNNSNLVDTNERLVSDKSAGDAYLYYRFADANKNTIVVWNNGGTRNISLNLPDLNGKELVIYDMYGNIIKTFVNNSNNISVNISEEPVYIVANNS